MGIKYSFNFITGNIYFNCFQSKKPSRDDKSRPKIYSGDSNTLFFPMGTQFGGLSSTGDEFWAYFSSGVGVPPGLWYRGVIWDANSSVKDHVISGKSTSPLTRWPHPRLTIGYWVIGVYTNKIHHCTQKHFNQNKHQPFFSYTLVYLILGKVGCEFNDLSAWIKWISDWVKMLLNL